MTLQERLDEVLRLEAEATPGPWFQWTSGGDISSEPEDCMIMHTNLTYQDDEGCCRATPRGDADCKFVVAARNILRPLGEWCKELHADRQTLKHRLDGVYGALADAENIVVSTDNPGESVRALTAERDKLRAECNRLNRELADMAHDKGYAEGRAMGLEHELEAVRRKLGERQPKSETESEGE